MSDAVSRVPRYDVLEQPVLTLATQAVCRGIGTDPYPFRDERSQQRLTRT